MTEQRFSEQRYLEDVDYDDAAIGEMLFNAYREQVYHSQREGLSVGQSSSSMSDRTVQPVVETGQELTPEHAQMRTLWDRQRELRVWTDTTNLTNDGRNGTPLVHQGIELETIHTTDGHPTHLESTTIPEFKNNDLEVVHSEVADDDMLRCCADSLLERQRVSM